MARTIRPEIPGMPKPLPRVLTMEDYNREWKPEGWNLIIIGPTSTWRQEWGEWEAIRDIVQNSLDETESYTWGYDREGLWIRDQGRGVAVADFLLGPPKLKPDWARGKFGEGMKIASLALLRQGYPVRVETVGREILMVFLIQEVDGRAETLAALWRSGGTKLGTTFHIVGYTGPAFEDKFAVNLPRDVIAFQAASKLVQPLKRFNQLIEYTFPTGSRIYARDIYMRDFEGLFSYNLWSFDMAPDRFGPKSEDDMYVDMARLWMCVDDIRLLGIFFQLVRDPPAIKTEESFKIMMDPWRTGDIPGEQTSYFDVMQKNAAKWQEAWVANFGEDAVLRTSDRWDSIVKHLGYKSMSVTWNVDSALRKVIKTDVDLRDESQERLRDVEIIADQTLNPTQRVSLALARSIIGETAWMVRGVHAAIIPPASDRVRTAGMYGRTTEEIYISAEQLNHAKDTVDTVVHEIAHATSGAEDGEKAHYEAISERASRVVMLTKQGMYDVYISNPDFRW